MIWLIGNRGMLGTEVAARLEESGFLFVGTDREVSITDFSALQEFALSQKEKIDFIINCSAYTAVDKAESDKENAQSLNVKGPENIALIARQIGAVLIHISTDYVFDGSGSVPKTEDMAVSPIGVYGLTKADGEKAVAGVFDSYYILRTAWLYGWVGKNFVYTMIKAMSTRDFVKVVSDQRGTPTFAGDLASAIVKIIERAKSGSAIPYGIYHFTDEGETSWYDFTLEIKKQALKKGLLEKDCPVQPCTTQEYPTPAKRPSYSVLSKQKIKDALGIDIPLWQESLGVFLSSPKFSLL